MIFYPYIIGSGKAAQAILEALKIIELSDTQIQFETPVRIKRGESIPDVHKKENSLLIIANPHALHADALIAGEKAGFKLMISEKPAATSQEKISALRSLKVPVAICHGYRQMWGPQTIRSMVSSGELGELIAIEGRYWQSSSAQKALSGIKSNSWKNDQILSGNADVLLDLATHWIDAAIFISGSKPSNINLWKSFKNSEAPHRDTHVQLTMNLDDTRVMASISKTVHGAPNHFELNIIGSKKYVAWKFLEQDLIETSEGSSRTFIARNSTDTGSGHWPHHSLGWLEGYVEVIKQYLKKGNYPTLEENLDMLETIIMPE